jgi:hypothetical protein
MQSIRSNYMTVLIVIPETLRSQAACTDSQYESSHHNMADLKRKFSFKSTPPGYLFYTIASSFRTAF